MKVVTEQNPFIQVVPRAYPILGDILIVEFENGITNEFIWTISKNLLIITFASTTLFKQRDNYSFTIFRGEEILYKGKMIFLKNGTDVQNYTNNSQDNKRWQ